METIPFCKSRMMEQMCDLETVKPQEIPVKACVIFYYIEICYRGCGAKNKFSCNHLIYLNAKGIVVGLSMVEGHKQSPEVFSKKRCS